MGMAGLCYHAQLFSVEMGVSKTFFVLVGLKLISASQVARIAGVSHCAFFLK
jgi:hypothetical protein